MSVDIPENDPSKKIEKAHQNGKEVSVKKRGKTLSSVLGAREAVHESEDGTSYLDTRSSLPVDKKSKK